VSKLPSRKPLSLTLILLALVAIPAVAVPDWNKVRLSVAPGIGTKHFQLGEPLPKSWPAELGEPDLVFPFHDTGEGLTRLTWGTIEKGQLMTGMAVLAVGRVDENTIIDIEIKRIRAGVDDENLFLGLPEETISKRSQSVQKDGKTSYILPGLTIETSGKKMIGLKVHSPMSTRWRFQRWRIRPGLAAGPIRLGEKVDKSLFQSIGEPHERSSELLLWQATESDQSLSIQLDPRTGTVTRVRGVGLPWRTPNGATLGDSPKAYTGKHPTAKSGIGRGVDQTILKLPGLRANFTRDKLTSFDIYPVPK
jgi:hypothetical protein